MRHSTFGFFSILDMPDEVLMEIMLYLNAGERIVLGNTSDRFYHILVQNKSLLRHLDFTKEHVPDGNLPEHRSTSAKLKNLLNSPKTEEDSRTQEVHFETVVQLGIFLDPFVHLERLSIEWPGSVIKVGNNLDRICEAWHAPFSRLRYLSVTLSDVISVTQVLASLHLCRELKELCIIDQSTSPWTCPDLHNVKHEQLENLEIVVFSGRFEPDYQLYHCITDLFTDSEEWTKLTISYSVANGFYFQKRHQFSDILGKPNCRYLSYDSLLELVLIKTHEIELGDLSCLLEKNAQGKRSLFQLKMEEIKLLLKGPRYETPHLSLNHTVRPDCMVHLVASAFPNLTELVLTNIVKMTGSTPQKIHPKKRLRRKGDVEPEDYWNVNEDSSFKMLVENTPRLKSLTINADPGNLKDDEIWDLDALPLIAGWKNLRSLCLKCVPIIDGHFLVVIRRQCLYLEKLHLQNLGSGQSHLYSKEFCHILTDCRNLRNFTILQ